MQHIIWFICEFIFVYIVYYILFIRNNYKKNKKDKMPTEVKYLVNYYKLDIKKFSYRKLLYICGAITSLDIVIVVTIVMVVKEMIFQILFGLLAIIPVTIISFVLLGKYYMKKQNRDNSKEIEKENKYIEKMKRKEDIKKSKKNNKDNKRGKKKNVK